VSGFKMPKRKPLPPKCRKVGYYSLADANRAIRQKTTTAHERGRSVPHLEAYLCNDCDEWHMTSHPDGMITRQILAAKREAHNGG
jgi:hypothetical protein